jgi:multiple sugar transport system permease protein
VTTAAEVLRRRHAGAASWADRNIRWLLITPAVSLIVLLTAFPLGYSLWVNFVQYDFSVPSPESHPWVGLDNFRAVIADPVAREALWHTAFLSTTAVALELVLGLLLALAMVRPFFGRRVLMPLFLLPLFMSPVIVGQFWNLMLQEPFGPTNDILTRISHLFGGGGVHPDWITNSPWYYVAIIVADAWQWTPFMFVILLAGLTSIGDDLYEAADLDGAKPRQSFFFVTLPLLAPVIILAVTFRLLDAVKLFDIIYTLTGGGPGTATYTASYYLYQQGFQLFHLGEGTAGSWLFMIMIAIVASLLVRRLLRPQAV